MLSGERHTKPYQVWYIIAYAQDSLRLAPQNRFKRCSDRIFLVGGPMLLYLFHGGACWYRTARVPATRLPLHKSPRCSTNHPTVVFFWRVEGGSCEFRSGIPALAACHQRHGRITMEYAQDWKGKDSLSGTRGSRAFLGSINARTQAMIKVRARAVQ